MASLISGGLIYAGIGALLAKSFPPWGASK